MIKNPIATTLSIIGLVVLLFTFVSYRAVSSKEDEVKADAFIRYGLARIDVPKPIEIERVVLVIPPETVPMPAPKPAVKSEKKIESNVCTRHGMRKVSYGKRWRCKR
jgi:type IV secretory pathway protease TraF